MAKPVGSGFIGLMAPIRMGLSGPPRFELDAGKLAEGWDLKERKVLDLTSQASNSPLMRQVAQVGGSVTLPRQRAGRPRYVAVRASACRLPQMGKGKRIGGDHLTQGFRPGLSSVAAPRLPTLPTAYRFLPTAFCRLPSARRPS